MTLAAAALLIPAAFAITTPATELTIELKEELSIGLALILLGSYAAQLIFSLRTHKHLYTEDEVDEMEMHGQVWSVRHSIIVLAGATILVAIMSEIWSRGGRLSDHSARPDGVVRRGVLPGGADRETPPSTYCIDRAMKNKMDMAVNIATGSPLQIALFRRAGTRAGRLLHRSADGPLLQPVRAGGDCGYELIV